MADIGHLVARIAELEGEVARLKEKAGETRQRRIALGIVLEKVVQGDVFGQWIELLRRAHFPGPTYRMRPLYVVQGRNQLVTQALEAPVDAWDDFYFYDSDMLPEVELVSRLVELADSPLYQSPSGGVICGHYYGRDVPHELQLFQPRPERKGLYFIPPDRWLPALIRARQQYLDRQPADLIPIGGGGTGSMLIRRDVLQRMQDLKGRGNIFETHEIGQEVRVEMAGGPTSWAGETWSEDIWFCIEVAERLGVQVYGDTDLRMSSAHLAERRVSIDDYIRSHAVMTGNPPPPRQLAIPQGYALQPMNRQQRRAIARGLG